MADRTKINRAQRIAAKAYGDGGYKHITQAKDYPQLREELKTCGDIIFQGVMIELANAEDCVGIEEALRRVRQIINDVAKVRDALDDALHPLMNR